VKASPTTLPPAAIAAERDWLVAQQHFKPEWQPVLDRLCKAPIWNQLGKRKPVMSRAELIRLWGKSYADTPDESVSDKEIALRVAFLRSFFLAVFPDRTMTIGEIKKRAASYQKRAKRLRDEAAAFLDLGNELVSLVGDPQEHAEALNRAAAGYEAGADELTTIVKNRHRPDFWHPLFEDGRLIVGRNQYPPEVRAYCVLIINNMRALYGFDLRGTVAAIATAALDHTVTAKDVQYWGGNKR
jgi:hypothetical protein